MRNQNSRNKRVLAIDPSTKGFGYAVLEDQDQLIDWGTKSVSKDKNTRCVIHIQRLICINKPAIVVVENVAGRGCRRSPRVKSLIAQIKALCDQVDLPCRSVSGREVREVFAEVGVQTKYEIACALASRFPELSAQLPPKRKSWMSEDRRMPLFGAISLACASFH